MVDMSVGYLMANTRVDFHVTASVMAKMERFEYNSRSSNPLDVKGSCGTKDDTAPLSVMNCLRKNDIAFFDIVRLGSDGETNSLDGVNSTERAAHLR